VHDALPHIEAGRLVPKLLAESRIVGTLYYTWNTSMRGRAMQWFLEKLQDVAVRSRLLP
jgi:hypothetical protein